VVPGRHNIDSTTHLIVRATATDNVETSA
jgi:hypothetical protein